MSDATGTACYKAMTASFTPGCRGWCRSAVDPASARLIYRILRLRALEFCGSLFPDLCMSRCITASVFFHIMKEGFWHIALRSARVGGLSACSCGVVYRFSERSSCVRVPRYRYADIAYQFNQGIKKKPTILWTSSGEMQKKRKKKYVSGLQVKPLDQLLLLFVGFGDLSVRTGSFRPE